MNKIVTIFMTVVVLTLAAASVAFATPIEEAKQAYLLRDFSHAGIQSSITAAELFGQVAAATADLKEQASFLAQQSDALYFAGTASEDKKEKIKYHLAGMQVADRAVKSFGITDVRKVTPAQLAELKKSLTPAQLLTLADSLYARGTNLGQWGQANGVAQSLGRWPELRDNMQLIIDLGMKAIREFGPYRTLARGYNQIPGILGGDNVKAEKYLKLAIDKTKATGEVYSVNGYNNTFYAEILRDLGRKEEAKALLAAFIKADPNTLKADFAMETKRSQGDAADFLKKW